MVLAASFTRNLGSQGLAPIGEDLVKMLESMVHRGRDSSGVTVAGEDLEEDLIVRLWTEDPARAEDVLARSEEAILRGGGVIKSKGTWDQFLRLTVNYEGEIPRLPNPSWTSREWRSTVLARSPR